MRGKPVEFRRGFHKVGHVADVDADLQIAVG